MYKLLPVVVLGLVLVSQAGAAPTKATPAPTKATPATAADKARLQAAFATIQTNSNQCKKNTNNLASLATANQANLKKAMGMGTTCTGLSAQVKSAKTSAQAKALLARVQLLLNKGIELVTSGTGKTAQLATTASAAAVANSGAIQKAYATAKPLCKSLAADKAAQKTCAQVKVLAEGAGSCTVSVRAGAASKNAAAAKKADTDAQKQVGVCSGVQLEASKKVNSLKG